MNKMTINGVEYIFNHGSSITVKGNQVIIDGQVLDIGLGERVRFDIHIHGNVENVKADGNVTVKGDVGRDVDAGGNVTAGNVGGKADAGGNITCGNVGGDVDAGGNVHAKDVRGDIDAGGNVRHG